MLSWDVGIVEQWWCYREEGKENENKCNKMKIFRVKKFYVKDGEKVLVETAENVE